MKTLSSTGSLFFLFATLLFCSCTKDQNENYYSTTKEFISQGKWSVDYYYAGADKTALLSGYHFNFSGNGTVNGTNGTDDFAGTWTVIKDAAYNEVLKITINSQDPNLKSLNDQWKVTGTNSLVISMKEQGSELRLKKL